MHPRTFQLVGLIAVALTALVGCDEGKATDGPDTTVSDLPKWSQVRSTRGDAATTDGPQRRLLAQKLIYTREDGRVDLMLSALGEPHEVPAELRALWRANGMRIAAVPYDRLELLRANLPPARAVHSLTIVPSAYYGPVGLVGRVDQQQVVRYVDTDQQASDRAFVGGQFRFLARLIPPRDPAEPPQLDLLPQHFSPRQTIQVRPLAERLLDGTTFDELRLDHALPPNTAWVIWCDLPAPETPAEQTDKPIPAKGIDTDLPLEDDPAPRPAVEVSPTGAAPAAIPPTLGETMMTGLLHHQRVRIVVVVTAIQAEAKRSDASGTPTPEPRALNPDPLAQ